MFDNHSLPTWSPAARRSTLDSTAADRTAFAISKAFAPRTVQLSYCGPITPQGVKTLVEHVETALTLYQPEVIAVHLHSPGGLMPALEYWVYRQQHWAAQGQIIATEADTECASAAAMMVTLGTVGKRSAHPLSQLLFHNPRMVGRDITLQEQDAEEVARVLKESRTRMHAMLSRHLIDSLGQMRFARSLHARAAWLLKPENQARQTVYSGSSTPAANQEWLDSWAQHRPRNEADARERIAQWSARIEEVFRKDELIDLSTAWALMLIDATETLPPLIEPLSTASMQDEDETQLQAPAHRTAERH